MNWNACALANSGTLSAAALRLKAGHTVSRRAAALEAGLGVRLFEWNAGQPGFLMMPATRLRTTRPDCGEHAFAVAADRTLRVLTPLSGAA